MGEGTQDTQAEAERCRHAQEEDDVRFGPRIAAAQRARWAKEKLPEKVSVGRTTRFTMGKFSPTTQHGDCEEIANISTAYGGGGATGSTPTVPCLPVRSSMCRAAISAASRCNTPIFVLASSSRARTARSPTASTGSKLVGTLLFRVWEPTSGAASDSAPACTRLLGWTKSRCAGSRTGACASRGSGSGLACASKVRGEGSNATQSRLNAGNID